MVFAVFAAGVKKLGVGVRSGAARDAPILTGESDPVT